MADEKRSPDQDAAMEAALLAGTLPAADRRHPDDVTLIGELQTRLATLEREAEAAAVVVPAPVEDATLVILDKAGVGSTFTKEATGWRISFVTPGGTALLVSGATMAEALASHGLQFTHDSLGNEHGASDEPQHDTVRS